MKLFTGWIISAGLVVAAGTANAQVLYEVARLPYTVVSDIGGPYAAMPPEAPVPGYGPRLLPPQEVYTVLRDNGFSPLGIPVRRGVFYTISAIDRSGDDGRLVIDARNGRILRFRRHRRIGAADVGHHRVWRTRDLVEHLRIGSAGRHHQPGRYDPSCEQLHRIIAPATPLSVFAR